MARNQKAIECCVCKSWVHQECSELSQEEFRLFEEMHRRRGPHAWACDKCLDTKLEFQAELDLMKVKMRQMTDMIEDNKARITASDAKTTTLETRVDKLESQTDNVQIIKDMEKNNVIEQADREARKGNMIVYNLPEPPAEITRPHARKEADKEEMKRMLNDIDVELDFDQEVRFFVRTGKLDHESDRIRPLLIGFKSMETKERVMRNAKKLSTIAEYENVSLTHDLTRKQRDEDQILRDTAKQRNEAMEEEESLNFEWRALGPKGNRYLVRMKKKDREGSRKRQLSGEAEQGRNVRPNTVS